MHSVTLPGRAWQGYIDLLGRNSFILGDINEHA